MSLQAALPRPTRFSIGRALGDSIGIFARNAFWLVPVACAARAVVLLAPEPAVDGGSPTWPDLLLDDLTDALASGFADAAIILCILQILRGHRASIGDMMAGFRLVIPLVVATAIVNLPWIALGIVDQVWARGGDGEPIVRWLLAFAIALVFYVHLVVSTQAIVIERIGPLAGLMRSLRLTKGRRWAIFGATIIPLIAVIMLSAAAAILSEQVFALEEWLVDAIDYLIAAISAAYFAVLTTILYYDLRREKEGADSGEIARVFD